MIKTENVNIFFSVGDRIIEQGQQAPFKSNQ